MKLVITSEQVWEAAQQAPAAKMPRGTGWTESIHSALQRSTWNIALAFGLPPNHHQAESWLRWAEPVSLKEATRGDTAIIKHKVFGMQVALFEGWSDSGKINLFFAPGASDPAKVWPVDPSTIRGIRRLRL